MALCIGRGRLRDFKEIHKIIGKTDIGSNISSH